MAVVQQSIKFPQWRRRLLLVLILLGFAALIGRAVLLQGVRHSFYQKEGEARYTRAITLYAHRGMITDRNGEPLAISGVNLGESGRCKGQPRADGKISAILGNESG
jgi:cell division protein FtsI/penicillin-binding protein 2